MRLGRKPLSFMLIATAIIFFLFLLMQPLTIFHFGNEIDVLFPKGIIALEQRNLLFILQALMLIVMIPVYLFTFIFSWKYRYNNPDSDYDPDLVDNKYAEVAWWGVPFLITLIIAFLTWTKTEQLDPYKPIPSEKKPITIQVVALQWKWLFLYPEEKIATVNYLKIPEKTPIHFEITADAPMNSFWIPDLGGQIYAMPNMKTNLYLMADEPGEFKGYSANISGEGFSGMRFITQATTEEEYRQWVQSTKNSTSNLNLEHYNQLAKPSENNPQATYQLQDNNLFNQIIMKYMHPQHK